MASSSYSSESRSNPESESKSSLCPKWIYDVFLSYTVNDSAKSFASLLYTDLATAGVNVFRGNDELRSGDQISSSVLQAIGVSRISVIVFSTNYAASKWCLQELEKIMECSRTIFQNVIPVFYEVDSSDVSQQKGAFGEAFEAFRQRIAVEEDKLMIWREALTVASNISGPALVDSRNKSKEVVEHVTSFLDDKDLFVAEHPVGVGSRVQDVIRLLKSHQLEHPLVLGIWGMGGIGKTCIAKAVYNQIRHDFEGKSFLHITLKESQRHSDIVNLQRRLLSDIFKTTKITIGTTESGKKTLQRLLVILDDVRDLKLLNTLCGSRGEWFGSGSIIILTTRDKHLLTSFGVNHVYTLTELDENESLELFSWSAFKRSSPTEDFVQLSRGFVKYSQGNPLALKVLGFHLFGKGISEWKSQLQKLKRTTTPNKEIHDVIKISFDTLDEIQKVIFLDIAHFYVGMNINDVIPKYGFHGSSEAEIAIGVLNDKSLVTTDENNKLGMHELLREFGRDSLREKSQQEKIYDVFLSFRGEDSRANFTSHLYSSLQNAGIYVYRDDDEIQRGDTISVSLLQAIRKCRIYIVVLSKNYANSKWCLLELENIIEDRRTMGMVVVPVFYEVDPSDVRNQTGDFGKAFEDLITTTSVENSMVKTWKTALREVGGIAGVVIINSRNESEDIKKVVEDVTNLLGKTDLFVAEHPVGVKARVENVIQLLKSQQSKDPLLLGIWGMGGMGKTTIAKAVYNQIGRDFEAKSFLLNVREVCEQNNGIVSSQQKLLSDIYKTTKIKIGNVESGKEELKRRLSQKKILLVLDDVNKLDQLSALCGSREWFRHGSRVIITTRDESMLKKEYGVEVVYRIKEMDDKESLELFSWHAFKQPSPEEGFEDLSCDVVKYCGRLPLALQVIGSFFLTRRRKKEWRSVVEKLRIIPNNEVMEKLKISFDGLSDDDIKEIFLDIAFFFIGMDQNDVIEILNYSGNFAEIGVSVLVQQSLVTIDRKNRIGMHDLLRDMGREIVRKRSAEGGKEPSRLWRYKDVHRVLSKDVRTMDVQGLTLKSEEIETTYTLDAKAFEKMDKLRLLQLAGVKIDGNYKYLSRDLRWLCWHRFPLKYTPADFHQESLVAIDFKYSNLVQVWKKSQMLKQLKFLNLSHSHNLRETPDFSKLPNLEKLVLKGCTSLSSISPTIGGLDKLLLINLKNCTGLHSLPRSVYKLKSLKTLILSGCSKIDKLEEDMEQMESLTTLVADNTAITRVPFAVVRSKSIAYITLCGYKGFSRDVFPSIILSWMSPTNNIFSQVQTFAAGMSYDILDEQSSSFYGILYAQKDLSKLQRLWVKCDSEVQLNQSVERILDTLKTTNCAELEGTASTSHVSNNSSALIDCHRQVRISGSKNSSTSLLIQMGMKCRVSNILKEIILQKMYPIGSGLLPSDNYPDWLAFNSGCSSVTFEVPQVDGRNLKAIMCIVYSSSPDNITSEGLKNLLVINCTKNTIQLYKKDALDSFDEEEWQRVVSNIEPGNEVKVVVVFENGFAVKNTTVYLIYDEPIDKKAEHYHELDKNVVAPSGDENRFGRLFFMLLSLVRALLISQPFWFLLAGILIGSLLFRPAKE